MLSSRVPEGKAERRVGVGLQRRRVANPVGLLCNPKGGVGRIVRTKRGIDFQRRKSHASVGAARWDAMYNNLAPWHVEFGSKNEVRGPVGVVPNLRVFEKSVSHARLEGEESGLKLFGGHPWACREKEVVGLCPACSRDKCPAVDAACLVLRSDVVVHCLHQLVWGNVEALLHAEDDLGSWRLRSASGQGSRIGWCGSGREHGGLCGRGSTRRCHGIRPTSGRRDLGHRPLEFA
jgi:hypothetical protein